MARGRHARPSRTSDLVPVAAALLFAVAAAVVLVVGDGDRALRIALGCVVVAVALPQLRALALDRRLAALEHRDRNGRERASLAEAEAALLRRQVSTLVAEVTRLRGQLVGTAAVPPTGAPEQPQAAAAAAFAPAEPEPIYTSLQLPLLRTVLDREPPPARYVEELLPLRYTDSSWREAAASAMGRELGTVAPDWSEVAAARRAGQLADELPVAAAAARAASSDGPDSGGSADPDGSDGARTVVRRFARGA